MPGRSCQEFCFFMRIAVLTRDVTARADMLRRGLWPTDSAASVVLLVMDMIKLQLREMCSGLMAIVLITADCRHLLTQAPADVSAYSDSASPQLRRLIAIEAQHRNEMHSVTGPADHDVLQQLSDLAALTKIEGTRHLDTRTAGLQ